MRELARWGLHSLPAPRDDENLAPGWLPDALETFFAPVAPDGSFEFRIGDEVAALVDGIDVEGDRELLEQLLDAAAPVEDPLIV